MGLLPGLLRRPTHGAALRCEVLRGLLAGIVLERLGAALHCAEIPLDLVLRLVLQVLRLVLHALADVLVAVERALVDVLLQACMALCTFEGMSGLDSGVGSLTCLACKGVRLLLRGLLNLIALLAHSLCLVVTGRVLDILRRTVRLFGGGSDRLGVSPAARFRKCGEAALECFFGILGALLDVSLSGLLEVRRDLFGIQAVVEVADKGLEVLDGSVGAPLGLLLCVPGAR
mmetsp:Transcript_97008/g.273716  ORF Transcript_97008/g.273716 Transcript_97008/m.273716 type:complete len:230 (-) Transcript_97008:182-871(-)